MSISDYIKTKEYIVTVNDFNDLDAIYDELETEGKSPPNTELERSVTCVHRKLTSRNTHYLLADWEADLLRQDPRINSVTPVPSMLGIKAGTCAIEQTSTAWDKSGSTSNNMKNWALLRCTEGVQRSGWGGTGYEGNGSGTAAQTGTITLTQTGKNVDVVICDEDGIVWNHPEYAVNSDGTGGTRSVQYNWGQHNAEIGNGSNGTWTYGTGSHSTHVSGTVAGNTQGWARSANIYNIYYDAGNTGNFSYVFDYIRAFHRNKSVNVATGRKNPTIVNNSWGMSIFPSEWSFSDITAVTYRGQRYTPSGAISYTGYSGVCTANARLASLIGEENKGNRIITSGPYTPPGGSIVSKPVSWSQEGQQAYLTVLSQPDASYEVTIQGPADIHAIHNVAVDAISGNMSLSADLIILNNLDQEIVSYTDGPAQSDNGGTVETLIDRTYTLPNNIIYKIKFNTTATNPAGAQYATAMSVVVVTESTPAAASVTEITNSLLGAASLTAYTNLSATNPNLPKIMWSCADNSVQRIYYGTEGTSPNRTYRVRVEGNAAVSGTVGSPGMVCEWTFYEAVPDRIDLQQGVNNRKTSGGGFTTQQLNDWGFISGQRIPVRVNACDSDIETLYSEGIIMVGAAGNGRWKHDVPGGLDWDNSFEMASRYPLSVTNPYFYMRGTSPTANDSSAYNLPAICVGSVDTIQNDQKVLYSDCGQGVDVWAPGTYIISALPSGTADTRNGSYYLGKYSGTSMASPQVAGVLACALEIYPHMNQTSAKAYILGYAKSSQLTATTGGPADGQDLQGAANLFLYYAKERLTSGNTFPKINYKPRPTSGAVYPRSRIRRTL